MQDSKKEEKRDVLKITVPAAVVADTVGVSESYVKQVRTGAKPANTETAKKIMKVEYLYEQGTNALIEAVKKLVKI